VVASELEVLVQNMFLPLPTFDTEVKLQEVHVCIFTNGVAVCMELVWKPMQIAWSNPPPPVCIYDN